MSRPAGAGLPPLPVWDPPVDPAAVDEAARALVARGVGVERDQPLGAATTLGVGGRAAAVATLPDDAAAAAYAEVLAAFPESAVPVFVLGKGSNTLVGDGGFDGLVVRLGAGAKWLRRDGAEVAAGAAEAMPALAAWVAREGLAGLEFAAGIPATVGGSVRMNAGAHGGETVGPLLDVLVAAPGRPPWRLPAAGLAAGYRHTELPPRAVVLAARWLLRADDPAAVRARLDALRAWRRAAQPLRERNCGSVFTNPPGDSAGRLVEAAGGKEIVYGGARISARHANFVTAAPGTSAADVRAAITAARDAVAVAGGPVLVPEVRLVGRFTPPA